MFNDLEIRDLRIGMSWRCLMVLTAFWPLFSMIPFSLICGSGRTDGVLALGAVELRDDSR